MSAKRNLYIDDSAYRASYGRAPRGRGSWAFCPASSFHSSTYLDHCVWTPSMTYADAKRWFKAQNKIGHWMVCT